MKKFFKIIFSIILIFTILLSVGIIYFFTIAKEAQFDDSKLYSGRLNMVFYNSQDEEIQTDFMKNRENIKLETLPKYVKYSFIAVEDVRFYEHGGLDYKRMVKALFNNVTSMSFKEGASTISQQLIKNTHLTNQKTLERKAKEIRLTKILEKKYTKSQILEMYLNSIYFGENAYGLNEAADAYFNKPAAKLTLSESAMLAGIICSPGKYSPFDNYDGAVKRKNLVLNLMLKNDFIDKKEFDMAVADRPLVYKKDKNYLYKSYIQSAYDEVFEKTRLNKTQNGKFRVYTFLDKNLQDEIESNQFNNQTSCKKSVVLIDNSSFSVKAFYSNTENVKRSPASAIKPVLVYAPALEYNIISPASLILDEETDFGNYSPSNFDKSYHGFVSAREALVKSYNIPAVKTLNYTGIDKSKKFAENLGITFTEEDKTLTLALGGFNQGVTLKQLAGAYVPFSNGGEYADSAFIRKIEDEKGNIIYEKPRYRARVMDGSTAYLITDMLNDCAKTGTASKLNADYEIAAKTGTNGNEKGNLDAYTISYTSENTLGIWYGNNDGEYLDNSVLGGTVVSAHSKSVWDKIYLDNKPADFAVPDSVCLVALDKISYDSDKKIEAASAFTPEKNIKYEYFKKGNLPKDTSTKFVTPKVSKADIKYENNKICIVLCQTNYYNYKLFRDLNGKKEFVYEFNEGNKNKDYTENKLTGGGKYKYSIIPYFKFDGKEIAGEEFYLSEVVVPLQLVPKENKPGNKSKNKKPDKQNDDDWWNNYDFG